MKKKNKALLSEREASARKKPGPGRPPKYDWNFLQKEYDNGLSTRGLQEKYGCAKRTLELAVRRGDLVTRPQRTPIEEFLVPEVKTSRAYLKHRIFEEGLMEASCSVCHLYEWQDQPIPIDLDHINGDKTDNRLENLRPLCANCHRQTPTWAGKNWRKYSVRGFQKGMKIVNPEDNPASGSL